MSKEEKRKILKVSVTQYYIVPMSEKGDKTSINGWSIGLVIKNWFVEHVLGNYHATRDSHLVYSKFNEAELIETDEFEEEIKDG